MKVTVKQSRDDNYGKEYFNVALYTDKAYTSVSFMDGEPEDANISRDFNDIKNIPGLLKEAYEAGKRGEDYDCDFAEVPWDTVY